MPLTISPHDRNTVYVGSQHVHRTTNRGQSWDVISPDLSTNDKSRQQSSGGLTGDNIGVEYAFTVMAIAESRLEKGLIWAGTNDGQVQLTRDAGKTWTNVTKNIPNLPPWGTVGNIEPSRFDAGTAYLTIDLHQVNNRDPFVYKTSDYGQDLAADHEWHPEKHAELRALHPGGSRAARSALSRNGERDLRLVRRWGELAAAADEHAARARVLDHGAGALQRSRDCDLRARVLDPGRHDAAPAVHAQVTGRMRTCSRRVPAYRFREITAKRRSPTIRRPATTRRTAPRSTTS